MADQIGCAHSLRSFRLPSVAEPIPHAYRVRKVLIPSNISIDGLPSEALAEYGGERGIRTLDPVLSGILA